MKKILLLIFCCLFFYSFLFSAYDENKFMQAGKAFLAKGDYEKAIKIFNFVIKQNPKNAMAFVYGGVAQIKSGKKELGIEYLEKAYQLTGNAKIKAQIDKLKRPGAPVEAVAQKQPAAKEEFKPVNLGLKAGINLASLTGDDVSTEGAKNLIGLCAGGFISYSFNPWFSLQLEGLYTQKGMSREQSISLLSITIQQKTNYYYDYLQAPILAKLSIQTGSPFIPVIYLGPAISFNTGASVYMEQTVNGTTTSDTYDESMNTSKMDVNIIAGAGIEIKAGHGSIILDCRYDMGLMTISDIKDAPEQPDVKTSAITIMAGYSF